MRDLIWITTPASGGKTTARLGVKRILEQQGWQCGLLSDGKFLVDLVNEDKEGKWHVRPHEGDPSFCITAQYPLDETVRRLVTEISEQKEGQVTLIELARGVGEGYPKLDISYGRLIEGSLIPEEILARSLFLYIESPYELRRRWNEERRTNPRDQLEGMSFYCPTMAMETHFQRSDFVEVLLPRLRGMMVPVYILENGESDYERFQREVEGVALRILKERFSTKEGQPLWGKEREP